MSDTDTRMLTDTCPILLELVNSLETNFLDTPIQYFLGTPDHVTNRPNTPWTYRDMVLFIIEYEYNCMENITVHVNISTFIM